MGCLDLIMPFATTRIRRSAGVGELTTHCQVPARQIANVNVQQRFAVNRCSVRSLYRNCGFLTLMQLVTLTLSQCPN